MNIKMDERYSEEIGIRSYSKYIVDNPNTPFYLVEWKDDPWQAKGDREEEVNDNIYLLKKGDCLCRGAWLERFDNVRSWYTMNPTRRECIVGLVQTVNANIGLHRNE